ncbi:MAG TPA: zinc protease [Marinobacter sp.]|uniref:Zinc protease n=2 Tax=root TaxID=1 RepID=A0A831R4D5_9GAMM|nr:aminopeptidase [Marinobacter antarcticus]HDZ39764.1 zinc protease [Marinobacter sp.]HEA52940.1 zinc protease [Marinobacter antarcticus]
MKQLSQIYTVLLLTTYLSGCSAIGYYTQAIRGHLALTTAGKPVDSFIVSKRTPDDLRNKLLLSRQARRFADRRLALPVGGAFTDYVVLDHPWVVVNLVAVPEFSLQPNQWCYPFLGCQAYRGYFHLEDARSEERQFRAKGYDTFVGGVTAYSTLGWFDDPLHSGFTNLPDERMVALMFHELAHRVVYIKGDTAFNESFATAVELEGLKLWLTDQGDLPAFEQALTRLELRNKTHALVAIASADLQRLYQQQGLLSDSRLRERKQLIFEELNAAYGRLIGQVGKGEDGENEEEAGPFGPPPVAFNNARIALFTQYNQYVPAFRQLLKQSGGDFPVFYRSVETLSGQPEEQRQQALQDLSKRFKENL